MYSHPWPTDDTTARRLDAIDKMEIEAVRRMARHLTLIQAAADRATNEQRPYLSLNASLRLSEARVRHQRELLGRFSDAAGADDA